MTRISIAMLFAVGMVPTVSGSEPPEAVTEGSIIVVIEGIRNEDGNIRIALFSSEDGFPGDPEKALTREIVGIEGDRAAVVFSDLPSGEYAIVACHDENENGEMNRNLFGKPTEGYCISNGVRGGISGPPSFEDARFILESDEYTINMEMQY